MLFVAILAALTCGVLTVPPSCVVGPWSEWSKCERNQMCQSQEAPESFPVTAEHKAKGQGRRAMQDLVRMKTEAKAKKDACLAAGTCPELVPPPSIMGERQDCILGLANNTFPCKNVDMLAFIRHRDLGYTDEGIAGNDMWVWHDKGEGDKSDDYVIMGHTHGSSFIRVTDPLNPEVLGILQTESDPSDWRDMKVIGNYAYIVAEALDHGMQVFDLTQLRGLGPNRFREFFADVTYHEVSNTHNIVANPETNTLFLVGSTFFGIGTGDLCDGGLHMVDVSDPLNPTFVGCFEEDGYVHDAQCVIYHGPDPNYQGREICFCYNEDDFTIADVTTRFNPKMLSKTSYLGAMYTHQGWTTEDFKFAVMNDELDERYGFEQYTRTYVWNIENLEQPQLVDLFISDETSIDHNLYIRGNYVHQTNYEAGYRLLNIDDTGTLTELAHFDVFPPRTNADFFGAWSNYPWLDYNGSPYVAVSSIEFGLFLLQPNEAQIRADLAEAKSGQQSRTRDIVYNPQETQCPVLEDKVACEPEGC